MVKRAQASVGNSLLGDSRQLRRPGWNLIHDVHPTPIVTKEAMTRPPMLSEQPLRSTSLTKRAKNSLWRRQAQWIRKHILVLLSPVAIITSTWLSSLPIIGIAIIGIYALLTLILKIPGRVSFWLATMVLVSIGVQFLLLPSVGRVDQSAFFVFLLLCVGQASLMLENRREEVPTDTSFRI